MDWSAVLSRWYQQSSCTVSSQGSIISNFIIMNHQLETFCRNLTNFGLSGTLPNSIDNLTALANM